MGRKRVGRAVVTVAMLVAGLSVLPETASAVLSGTNGNIVLSSGRGPASASDADAKLYLRRTFSGTGGSALPPTAAPLDTAAGQHRHPTWSPDRTKIAYARGDNNCNPTTTNCAIYVLDLTDPNATPQPITPANNVAKDRPAWSPDGTRIAYESEETDGSGQLDVLVDTEPFGSGLNQNLTNTTTAGQFEGKPAWTPDSQTIYYHTGDPNGTNTMGIVSRPANGGSQTTWLNDPGISEFQPSISPDGTRMCFALGSGFNGTADIRVAAISNPAGNTDLSDNVGTLPEHGDYNCTWSPDGTQVAYVRGTFGNGDLVMEPANDSLLVPHTLETTAGRFDGNPDWAPDGRPTCDDTTVNTLINTPVQIEVPCTDSGPQYERTDVGVSVDPDGNPTSGTVDIPLGLSTTTTYTPNQDFTGSDSFTVKVRDEIAFGSDRARVTVNVRKRSNAFEIVDVQRNKKKGTAELTVSVEEGPGQLALEGPKVKPQSQQIAQTASGAQAAAVQTELLVKAIGKSKKKLKKKGKAKVNAAVTYTPDLGDPNTLNQKVKLKRKLK